MHPIHQVYIGIINVICKMGPLNSYKYSTQYMQGRATILTHNGQIKMCLCQNIEECKKMIGFFLPQWGCESSIGNPYSYTAKSFTTFHWSCNITKNICAKSKIYASMFQVVNTLKCELFSLYQTYNPQWTTSVKYLGIVVNTKLYNNLKW